MAIKNLDIQLKDKDSNNLFPLAHKDALGRVISDTYLTSVDFSDMEGRVENVENLVENAVSGIGYTYAKTTSAALPPSPSDFIYTEMPDVERGYYIWRKSDVSKVSGDSSDTIEMIQGLDGLSSNITSIEIRYAYSDQGTDPTRISSGSWQPSIPSVASGSYLWTRVTTNYSVGSPSISYSVAYQGLNGDPGVSISSVENHYLATSYSSGVGKSDGAWGQWSPNVQTMDSTNQYLWNYESVYDSDGVKLSETNPTIIGRYGKDGKGITSVVEFYQKSSSSTEPPTTWVNPSVSPMPITTSSEPYLWNYEVIYYTEGDPVATTPHVVGVHGVSAVSYSLLANNYVLIRNQDSSISPTSVTFSLTSKTGTGTPSPYSGRFKIYASTDNST